MPKQLIISIGRELGSGGSDIAKIIAKDLGLNLYDKNILEEIASKKSSDIDSMKEFDEKPRPFISRRVREHTSSTEDIIAQMQFDYLKEKAASGESFVVVGRCASSILAENPGLVSIFVCAEDDFRIPRVMETFSLNRREAREKIEQTDKRREQYHNSYSETKWGDISSYDLCIKSSSLGIEKSAEMIKALVNLK